MRRRIQALVGVVAMMLTVVGVPSAGASSESAVRWTSFSESSECGRPYIGTPIMSRSGFLSDSELLLGPLGGYFGRTLGTVRADMVYWTVPMSSGRRVLVHEDALAAFEDVAANLAAEQAKGRYYPVTSVAAYTQRTINGARQLSRHALGISIDVNPAQNPYSSDPDVFITDMPQWYVDAWADAGFCWGGSWKSSKDPMHFAWMGPAPGEKGLSIAGPIGSETAYRDTVTYETAWGSIVDERPTILADLGGFGALDVGTLREHPRGTILDIVSARSGFQACSHYRWLVDAAVADAPLIAMGDIDADSRSDLVALELDGTATIARRIDEFKEPQIVTGLPMPEDPTQITIGDWDGDRIGDLWILGGGSTVQVVSGTDFATVLASFELGVPVSQITIGDRDGDGTVELFAAEGAGRVSIFDKTGSMLIEGTELSSTPFVALAAADEDGDGRSDIGRLGADGRLHVATGNTPTGRPVDGWWRDPAYDCDDDPLPLEWTGAFYDDDTSIFEKDIELVAELGITRGCNPPFNDAFCPEDEITRGQMAAFLVRMLGLPAPDDDHFGDDGESEFEDDINRLAEAGITKGCTPTRFCPDDGVTRGEMAAFLVRALGLVENDQENRFVDDDQSVFERDIELLATAGITRGCNPPAGDRYCPEAPVARGEMAAFLGRATQIE